VAGLAVCGGSLLRGLEISLPGTRLLQRHGGDRYLLPHAIDHLANMRSLAEAGCDRVLGIGSVGGLRPELPPGTLLCPDDFVALGVDATPFDDERAHRVPGFDPGWRRRVIESWRDRVGAPIVDGGIYWQTRGPRLETPAEIRLLAAHADVVGMTIASECLAASGFGLAYAAICMVDNLANGVGERELTTEELEAGRSCNRATLPRALAELVPALG
jgi:5'-methylthioadenosine phosphorylase